MKASDGGLGEAGSVYATHALFEWNVVVFGDEKLGVEVFGLEVLDDSVGDFSVVERFSEGVVRAAF